MRKETNFIYLVLQFLVYNFFFFFQYRNVFPEEQTTCYKLKMNLIIIIITFSSIIIENAQSQLNQSEISVDFKNRQKRDLPDVV